MTILDPLPLCEDELGLVTDMYRLTVFAANRKRRCGMRGSFEPPFRGLPPRRGFVVAEEGPRRARDVAKRSVGERPAPGTKQAWHRRSPVATMVEDWVTAAAEPPQRGLPEQLLEPWLVGGGRLCQALPVLRESRKHALRQRARLPAKIWVLHASSPYPVRLGSGLRASRRGDARTGPARR